MDFQNYLKTSAQEIEYSISLFRGDWATEIIKISPKLSNLTNIFSEAWDGGKRLRGALVKLGFEITSNDQNAEILKVSAAYEIFQTSILAHDDVIDLSPTRRGKPTLYRLLGGDHYAISQTICLGDIGFFLANKMIAESDFPADRKVAAITEFSKMFIRTGLGQMLDIELPHLDAPRDEADVTVIQKLKTADYTIVYPLIVGAILGGGDQTLFGKIKIFGDNLGVAFQIQDDILGVFGDEKELGKSVTSDIEEGKNTLLITYATSHANDQQNEILNKYYGTGQIDPANLEEVKQIFIDTGALDYSKQKALEYVAVAKRVIPEITADAYQQQLLREMAVFLVERNK